MAGTLLLSALLVLVAAACLAEAEVVRMVEYPAGYCGGCGGGEICAGYPYSQPYCQQLLHPHHCGYLCRYPWEVCTSTGIMCITTPCPTHACVTRRYYPW